MVVKVNKSEEPTTVTVVEGDPEIGTVTFEDISRDDQPLMKASLALAITGNLDPSKDPEPTAKDTMAYTLMPVFPIPIVLSRKAQANAAVIDEYLRDLQTDRGMTSTTNYLSFVRTGPNPELVERTIQFIVANYALIANCDSAIEYLNREMYMPAMGGLRFGSFNNNNFDAIVPSPDTTPEQSIYSHPTQEKRPIRVSALHSVDASTVPYLIRRIGVDAHTVVSAFLNRVTGNNTPGNRRFDEDDQDTNYSLSNDLVTMINDNYANVVKSAWLVQQIRIALCDTTARPFYYVRELLRQAIKFKWKGIPTLNQVYQIEVVENRIIDLSDSLGMILTLAPIETSLDSWDSNSRSDFNPASITDRNFKINAGENSNETRVMSAYELRAWVRRRLDRITNKTYPNLDAKLVDLMKLEYVLTEACEAPTMETLFVVFEDPDADLSGASTLHDDSKDGTTVTFGIIMTIEDLIRKLYPNSANRFSAYRLPKNNKKIVEGAHKVINAKNDLPKLKEALREFYLFCVKNTVTLQNEERKERDEIVKQVSSMRLPARSPTLDPITKEKIDKIVEGVVESVGKKLDKNLKKAEAKEEPKKTKASSKVTAEDAAKPKVVKF